MATVGTLHFITVDCRGQEGVIRLFNGSSVSDGEVQYCLGSTWTPVCGDDWDESEAAVACRHLGFAGEGMKCRITFSHEVKEILRDNFT